MFRPARSCYPQCPACSAAFKLARLALVKRRTLDGVRVAELQIHMPALRSDDPDAAAWLELMRTELLDGGR